MLDDFLRDQKDRILLPISKRLSVVSPNTITLGALFFGILTAISAAYQFYYAAAFLWGISRFADGLDGAIARNNDYQSDFGGYVDILADFIVYAVVPIGVVWGEPSLINWLMLALLLSTFYVNGASWMYLSAILEKRRHRISAASNTAVVIPSGLIGGTETIGVYFIFLLWSQHVAWFFGIFAILVWFTIGQRLVWAARNLG